MTTTRLEIISAFQKKPRIPEYFRFVTWNSIPGRVYVSKTNMLRDKTWYVKYKTEIYKCSDI